MNIRYPIYEGVYRILTYELPSLNSQFLISLRINVSSSYERKQARTGFLPERSTPLPG